MTLRSSTHSLRPLADAAFFVRCMLTAPASIGAIVPSSHRLAHAVTGVLDDCIAPNVVELGPGTGPMTKSIQGRLAGTGRHVAVELNSAFAQRLAQRFPQVDVVCDTATDLPRILKEREVDTVDVVVSSLPISVIPPEIQRDIMNGVISMLHPERGVFTTVNYVGAFVTPGARRFRRMLCDRFENVVVNGPVLRNIPPAYVLTARRARPA